MESAKILIHHQTRISQKADVHYQTIHPTAEALHLPQTMELHLMDPTQEATAATPIPMTFTATPMYSSKLKRLTYHEERW